LNYELILNLFYFFISCSILIISGAWCVRSLTHIAETLRLSKFFTAFILMAFATSIPELFIGITSALKGKSSIALGTIIGSNILDLTLIAGITIIIVKGIKVKDKGIHKNAWWMCGIALLPVILFIIGGELSRIDGIILLITFFSCIYFMYKQHKHVAKSMKQEKHVYHKILSPFIFLFSLFILYVSADKTVFYASNIAVYFYLPEILIGLFIISLGTSLPELVFETKAVLTGFQEMALGDLIGSVVTNSTLVLGVTALIYPISANLIIFLTSSVFMLVITFLFATFLETNNGFSWKEGVALILMFLLFILLELTVKGVIPAASVLV